MVRFIATIIAVATLFGPTAATASDFTCTFDAKGEKPFVFYVTQINVAKNTAQLTIAGEKPVRTSVTVKGDIITVLGHQVAVQSETTYLATIVLGKKQPFKALYSGHFIGRVKEIDMVMPTSFSREGTCVATKAG